MKRIFLMILMMGPLSMTVACNSGSSGSSSSGTVTTTAATTCASGYVYSSTYGCLLQSTCPTGYGLYNNQCVVATSTAYSTCATGYTLYNGTCVYSGTTTTTTTCGGSCAAGMVQTVYGCMAQASNCQACYARYGSYCLGGPNTGYTWYVSY